MITRRPLCISCTQLCESCSSILFENIVVKGEIARDEQLLYLSQCDNNVFLCLQQFYKSVFKGVCRVNLSKDVTSYEVITNTCCNGEWEGCGYTWAN